MEMRVRARTAWPGRGDRMRARRCQRRRRRRRHTTQPAESTPVNRRRTHGVYVYTRSKSRRLGSFRPSTQPNKRPSWPMHESRGFCTARSTLHLRTDSLTRCVTGFENYRCLLLVCRCASAADYRGRLASSSSSCRALVPFLALFPNRNNGASQRWRTFEDAQLGRVAYRWRDNRHSSATIGNNRSDSRDDSWRAAGQFAYPRR